MKLTINEIINAVGDGVNKHDITVNPYLQDIELDVKLDTSDVDEYGRITVKGKDLVRSAKLVLFDNSNFIKFYHNKEQDFDSWMLSLSISAKKVLFYIFEGLHYNTLRVMLHVPFIEERAEMSKTSVYTGIAELVEKDIIRQDPIAKKYYFININKFFRGDRIQAIVKLLTDSTLYSDNVIPIDRLYKTKSL